MIARLSIFAVGVLIISFGVFGLLSMAGIPGLSLGQILLRGVPYTLMLVSGLGIVIIAGWARAMIIAISVFGLALQVFEISMGLNFKDAAEALLFMFLILFFSGGPIKARFNR